ncbi:MAG: cysteine desulfurase family protein [bacterium]|nr:cysteine desulfurase family protein [bacterium]
MRKKFVYLDYASSTSVDPLVLKAMLPFLKGEFGNPSSSHQSGQRARGAVEKAREQVASFLGCSADEIVFTSGATEANNLAIQGVLKTINYKLRTGKPHIIISSIEHESVLAPVQELERQGRIEATYIIVGKEGIVDPVDVEKAIKENTVLVSIQYANSEIGTIQPIAEIGKIIRKRNESSVVGRGLSVIFHTDAVQAAPYLSCNIEKLGVDMLTLSSHKVYGPKGVGALYIRKGVSLRPFFWGGGQEQDLRPGTENVAGIVGMGKAVEQLSDPRAAVQTIRIRQLRDFLQKEVQKRISKALFTGSTTNRLPNNAHFLIEGVEGKDIVMLLDQKGIAVSTGSACSEAAQEPSHVLLAMGYSRTEALSALRITLGNPTKKEDVEKGVKALQKVVEQLRIRR